MAFNVVHLQKKKMDRLFELLSYFSFSVNKLELNVGSRGERREKMYQISSVLLSQIDSFLIFSFFPLSSLVNELKDSCWSVELIEKNLRANCLTNFFFLFSDFFPWTKKDFTSILRMFWNVYLWQPSTVSMYYKNSTFSYFLTISQSLPFACTVS